MRLNFMLFRRECWHITAYWKGYKEYHSAGKSRTLPKMLGFQAAGSAPIVYNRIIENPQRLPRH